MRIYTGNKEYKLDPRRLYAPLQEYAEQIASCYDKKQLTEVITTGIPTIVTHHIHPAMIHARPPIIPPQRNQSIFPNNFI